MSPLWKKAPLVLFRFPALFLSIGASTLLLGAAVVSADLFTSAVGDAALSSGIERVDRYQAGLAVVQPDGFYGDGDPIGRRDLSFRVRDKLLLDATSGIENLGGRVLTILGKPLVVSASGTSETGLGRLISRTDAHDHVTKLSGDDGNGVWIADSTAETLGLQPGDQLKLQGEDGGPVARVDIDAVYRNLRNEPASPYWSSLYRVIHPDDPLDPDPPPLLLVDPDSMVRLSLSLGQDAADFRWQFPLDSTGLPLDEAHQLDRSFVALASRISNSDTRFGRTFPCLNCRFYGSSQVQSRQLGHLIAEAEENVASLRGPLELVSVAGILVALVVIGAAGAYSGQRRRSEVMVLFARGLSPGAMAGKTAVESLLPCVLGALVGALAAELLVGLLGPAGSLGSSGIEQTLQRALLSVPIALAVIACVAALGMAKESTVPSRERGRVVIPWELPLLLAAVFALTRILSAGALDLNESDVPSISPFLLLFPVLFIAAFAGWGARGFRRAAQRIRDRGEGFAIAPWLAVNRLAGGPRLVRTLLCACALAIGVFVYAHTMSVSLSQTTHAKASVSVGSDVSVLVGEGYEPPEDFPFPTTRVVDIIRRPELAGAGRVEVEAIDTSDFGEVAFWDGRFGRDSLSGLGEELVESGSDRLPVIAVGDVADRGDLDFQGGSLPFEVTQHVTTFPGIAKRPGIVADVDELARRAEELGFDPLTDTPVFTDLWVKGHPVEVRAALQAQGFAENDIVSLDDVLRRPAFLSTLRTFGFLKVLGAAAALLALIGLALYGQARQRGRAIAFAVSRKMGLTRRAHLRSLLLEFGAILATAGILGAILGLATAGLLYSEVDPIPTLSPEPLLNVPNGIWLPLGVALTAAVAAGSALAQRAANRANVAEELRRGQ